MHALTYHINVNFTADLKLRLCYPRISGLMITHTVWNKWQNIQETKWSSQKHKYFHLQTWNTFLFCFYPVWLLFHSWIFLVRSLPRNATGLYRIPCSLLTKRYGFDDSDCQRAEMGLTYVVLHLCCRCGASQRNPSLLSRSESKPCHDHYTMRSSELRRMSWEIGIHSQVLYWF